MSEHRLGSIVIERPRNGMRIRGKKITGYKKALDKLTQTATEEGLLRPYLIKPWKRTKYFSDNLSPLKRWLRSQLGQPWDNVYSQLRQKIETRTLCGQHLLFHLWGFVERDVELINDVPYRRGQLHPLGYWRDEFYIHPETKILCVARKPLKPKPQKPKGLIQIDSYHQYRQLDEIWYLISFKPIAYKETVTDILLHKKLTYQTATEVYAGQNIYAAHKRHCTKKEIKQILKQLAQN